ncbi:hypothetical protein ACFC1T_19545 [Kitasatospora sp. NPDC056076]|uniref:hypothetical protein n=1 Tax=Kitasatospora sp. NPDC056076 TaxID=3345703 RepID=UPI0035E15D06
MSKQGAPAQPPRPDDGWWDTVYDGPAGTLPDTPHADPGDGSVDDWFDTAAGLIGPQRTAPPVPEPAAEAAEELADEPAEAPTEAPVDEPAEAPAAERDSIDDWFDDALGVIEGAGGIGRQRSSTETQQAPEPPAAEPEPEPEQPPTPVSPVPPVSLEKPGGELAPAPTPPPAATPEPEPEPDHAPQPDPEPVAPVPVPASVPDPRLAIRTPLAETPPTVPHVGERPPTYGPEPTAVPEADPDTLDAVVPDTALEGAQYGATVLRAVSVRGDSARYRGEPRRDSLLVTRFGDGPDGLLLAVLAGYERTGGAEDESLTPQAVAAGTGEACRQLAATIGRSRTGLAADLRDGARDRLRYGLQRLATGAAAPLRTLVSQAEGDDSPSPASLHCLLMSLDPAAGYRAAFGVGPGGLYLLRSGHWIDAYAARLLHHPDGQPPVPEAPVPDPRPFRFRLVPATPGDILLLCTPGLSRPIADEPAVAHFLSSHWAHPHPPGTVDFLRQVQVRAKGYADDRTAAAIWTE